MKTWVKSKLIELAKRLDQKFVAPFRLAWINNPGETDKNLALYTTAVVAVLLAVINPDCSNLGNFFGVLAGSAGSVLGFVIAALTLTVQFIPQVGSGFTKKQLSELFDEFYRAFVCTLIFFAISLIAILFSCHLVHVICWYSAIYFMTTVVRTMYLLLQLNRGFLETISDQLEDAEKEKRDVGEFLALPPQTFQLPVAGELSADELLREESSKDG